MATRHAGYDNCKLFFVYYVVLWHLVHLSHLEESPSWVVFYWKWHEKMAVPGFVFLSGYFGKGFLPSDQDTKAMDARWEKTTSVLLLGAALLQLFHLVCETTLHWVIWGDWVPPSAVQHLWGHLETWYLIALFLWRLSTPVIGRLRHPLVVSLLVAMISLHMPNGEPIDMRMRVLHFLPYYVAGLYCEERWINSIHRPRLVGFCGLVLTLVFYMVTPDILQGTIYFVHSFKVMPHLHFFLQYMIVGVHVLSVILLLRIVPAPLFPFSHPNSSLAIYEWHWTLANIHSWGNFPYTYKQVLNPSPVRYTLDRFPPWLAVLMFHVLAYCVCAVLGSTFFWRLCRHMSDPSFPGLFRVPNDVCKHGEKEERSDPSRLLETTTEEAKQTGPRECKIV